MSYTWPELLLLTLLLAVFVGYAVCDNLLHLRARKVSQAEHLLHLVLGVAIFGLVAAVYQGNLARMVPALGLFAAGGLLDEFVFHRGLPEPESDVHAKQHLSLFLFVALGLVLQVGGTAS